MINCGVVVILGWLLGFVFKLGVIGIAICYAFVMFLLCIVMECIIRKTDLNTVEIDLD